MEDRLEEILSIWGNVPTWHSPHPLDDRRFHRAMAAIVEQLGTEIDEETMENAIRRVTSNAPAGLDRSGTEEDVQRALKKAMHILEYEQDRRSPN